MHQLNAALFVRRVTCRLPGSEDSAAHAASLEETVQHCKGASAPLWARAVRQALWLVMATLLLLRVLCAAAVAAVQWRVPRAVPVVGGASLYDKSALARQLHLRIRDYVGWPAHLLRLRRMRWDVARGRRWHPADELFAQTQAWHDMLWRFLLDFALGICACLLLASSPALVAAVLRAIHTFGQILHIDVLRAWVDWLMGLPAGLKLNHFAGRKLGGAVLSLIHSWEFITTYLTPWEPAVVVGVGLVGLGGVSLLLALTSDILELATLHIYTLYSVFAWLHRVQVGLLSSLWKLFRGRKRNVLRGRVDSNAYDTAQLLLGTLCFTVVFFLFPTPLVYYAFFVAVHLGIQAVHGALWWLTTLVNNAPIYTVFCLLFSQHQLPAGIRLSLLQAELLPHAIRRRTESTLDIVRTAVPGALAAAPGDLEDEAQAAAAAAAAAADMAPPSTAGGWSAPSGCRQDPPSAGIWLRLHPAPAPLSLALAPMLAALGLVMQRYSLGVLLNTILWGEPGLSLFRSVDDFGAPAASRAGAAGAGAAAAAVASTGISFGIVNAAANAPVDTFQTSAAATPAATSGPVPCPTAAVNSSPSKLAKGATASAEADKDGSRKNSGALSSSLVALCAEFWAQLVELADLLCFDPSPA